MTSDATVNEVRVAIYRSFVEDSRAPTKDEIAQSLGITPADVDDALEELDATDVIALHPGTHDIWLAHPFCAEPTSFETRSGDRRWDAICIWDALGVLAVVGVDGRVETACPDCGETLAIDVRAGAISSGRDYVVHYGVPAARWYEDIAFT